MKLDKDIYVVKRLHEGWKEFDRHRKKQKEKKLLPQIKRYFGKYQYVYISKRAEISLIKLFSPTYPSIKLKGYWEICCLSGDLFEDVEKFGTRKCAEEKIMYYLKRRWYNNLKFKIPNFKLWEVLKNGWKKSKEK